MEKTKTGSLTWADLTKNLEDAASKATKELAETRQAGFADMVVLVVVLALVGIAAVTIFACVCCCAPSGGDESDTDEAEFLRARLSKELSVDRETEDF